MRACEPGSAMALGSTRRGKEGFGCAPACACVARRRCAVARGTWALVMTGLALVRVAAGGPSVQAIQDVTIKACADKKIDGFSNCPMSTTCVDGDVQLVLGHTDPTKIAGLTVTQESMTPALGTAGNPLRNLIFKPEVNMYVACPAFKKSGRVTVVVKIKDESTGESITTEFAVVVEALVPVFDDAGPTRTVVDIRTIVGTPTYPYFFLVGHEDPDKVDKLQIEAFSDQALVVPNTCTYDSCSQTKQFLDTGGIYLEMAAYDASEGLTFPAGSVNAYARRVKILIRPSGQNSGQVKVTLRITDGETTVLDGSTEKILHVKSDITVFVNERPELEKFCAYDIKAQESLASIANLYGMHWMTIFLMNNHTLKHPDNLVPGTRISLGRPYIVKKGDSLYSIAVRYGTTWQHIHALNPAIVADEKNLFEGQLLCLAPDLSFIACRHRNDLSG